LCVGIFTLNYLLIIAGFGIAGVGFATGLIYVFYNFARSFYIYRAYGLNPFKFDHWKMFALALLLIGMVYGLEQIVPFNPNATTFMKFLRIGFIEFLVFLVFVVPVVLFNLEPETAEFIQRKWKGLSSRFKK
jgi:hypothetical protein